MVPSLDELSYSQSLQKTSNFQGEGSSLVISPLSLTCMDPLVPLAIKLTEKERCDAAVDCRKRTCSLKVLWKGAEGPIVPEKRKKEQSEEAIPVKRAI